MPKLELICGESTASILKETRHDRFRRSRPIMMLASLGYLGVNLYSFDMQSVEKQSALDLRLELLRLAELQESISAFDTQMADKNIKIYSNRGQGVILVLYSLSELGGICSKQEVLRFIDRGELYEITRHDLPPYDDQCEPRYQTLLAWARKDAMEKGFLIQTNERDAWQLSRAGREVLDRALSRFRSGMMSVRKCYLWTPRFKKLVDPTYTPSPDDAIRPEDTWLRLLEEL